MKIGITAHFQFSLFSGGAGQTSLAIAEVFRHSGHEVWLINTNPSNEWWDDCKTLKGAWDSFICKLTDFADNKEPSFDLVIEVDKPCFPNGAERKRIAKKSVWLIRKSPILHDIEASLFPFDNSIRNVEGFDSVWAFDQTCSDDDLKYIEVLTRTKAIFTPFLWTPSCVETYRTESKSPEWIQVTEALGKENPWRVHICETNNSVGSSLTLPLVILKNAKMRGGFPVKEWISHNSDHVSKSQFFQNNVRKHCEAQDLSGTFMGRQRIIDWVYDPKSCILSHSRFTTVRPFHLDAAWIGMPMVHNSQFLRDLNGSGYEHLYYPDNDIVLATEALQRLQSEFEGRSGVFRIESRNTLRQSLMTSVSPFSNTIREKYNEILSKVVGFHPKKEVVVVKTEIEAVKEVEAKTSKTKKTVKVLFTDMWDGFNPAYNMFIVMMNEAGRHLEPPVVAEGYSLQTLQAQGEKPDLVLFGPFGEDWFQVDKDIPKVHFSGENSKLISHESVKLNMGFQHADFMDQQYLRLPLWMLEVDWFGVDKEKIVNPKPLPIDRCTQVYSEDIPRKKKFCAFVVTNPCNSLRNNSFLWLNQYKQVDSAGRLYNNVGNAIFAGLGGGGGELKKFEFLKDYKFCLAYENSSSQGYTTEKYLHAKAAGCIPIYWGDPKFERDFDVAGCIDARRFTSPEELIEAVRLVDENPTEWLKKYSVPALDDTRRDLTRRTLSECSRRLLKLALRSDEGLEKIPRFLGAKSDKEALELAAARGEVPPSTSLVVPDSAKLSPLRTSANTFAPISSIIVCTGATQRFLPSLHQWLVSMTAQRQGQGQGLSVESDIWLGDDINDTVEKELTKEFSWVRFHRYPSLAVEGFDDFWNPQHFAWKLWILNEMAGKAEHSGKLVFYLDSGAFMCRWPIDWLYIAKESGICFLEDPRETNEQWCSDIFCKELAVTPDEKKEQQLWAGAIAFESGHPTAVKLFSEALAWGKKRNVVVGPKWEGMRNGKPYGHRHDQSILSILSSRHGAPRYPMDLLYCAESLRRTFLSKKALYVHRGAFQVHKPFLEGIDDCYVINLDRRADRMAKLFANSPELVNSSIQRISAIEGKDLQLTPAIARLFRTHDFGWKKPVLGCALSHLKLWWQLANERDDIQSYLILEDDVQFQPGWQKVWEEAHVQGHIPENYDVIYFGGILPPNRVGFDLIKEKVNPHISRVAENNFFGQQPKNRYFHWCAYSYVLSKQGARKIIEMLHARDGYWTSADHMICNMVSVMNIYFFDPLLAGCYQDNDPKYQTSQFNDFSRVDEFDSDLWNNKECFDASEATHLANMNIPIDIPRALKDAEEREKEIGLEDAEKAKEHFVEEVKDSANTKSSWESILEKSLHSNPMEALQQAFDFLDKMTHEPSIEELKLLSQVFSRVPTNTSSAGIPMRDTLLMYKAKLSVVFENSPDKREYIQVIIKTLETLFKNIESTKVNTVGTKGKRLFSIREQNLSYSNLYEATWLKEVFGENLNTNIYLVDENDPLPEEIPILILMRPWNESSLNLLHKWHETKTKFFVLHLSDEVGRDPIFFYGWDECLGIIRNYWRDDIEVYGEKVLVLPLGYHWTKGDGIPDVEKDTPRLPFRENVWSFAGTNWNGRKEQMANLSLIQPFNLHWFKEWNDSTMFGKDAYLNMLLNSRFVPCPGGVNPETYRLYEALECGCIPLYVRQENDTAFYEKHLKANLNMIELPTWDHAAAFMYQLNNDPSIMEGYRHVVLDAYTAWKKSLKEKVKAFLT